LLHELGDLDKDWAKTIKVKGGKGEGDYNLDQKALLQEAIKISAAIQMEDFQRFFKLFKRTNYMFACLMLNFFRRMRECALDAL